MNKPDISKILATGTPKQKLKLIAEDDALAERGFKEVLTEKEYNTIIQSFKTPQDRALLNKLRDNQKTLLHAVQNMDALFFASKFHLAELAGYCVLWDAIQKTEIKVNLALDGIEDVKKRKKIAEEVKKAETLILTKEVVDKEGYIELRVGEIGDRYISGEPDQSFNLMAYMTVIRGRALREINNFLAYTKVLKDWMRKEDLRPSTHADHIKDRERTLRNENPITPKYIMRPRENGQGPDEVKRRDKLLEKYRVFPDIKTMKPDPDLIQLMKKTLGIDGNK